MKSRFKTKVWYSIYLMIVTILLLEVALRIYNPFHFRIKGDHIVLDANKTYEVDNTTIPVIDQHIIHTKNSLGFRGPEQPADFERYLSIVTVGGSTTECQYLNDGKTWTDELFHDLQKHFDTVWVNNAGLAGHSTFGHITLLEDHIIKLKPGVILFFVGINDVERDDLTDSDKSNMTNRYRTVFTFLSKKSELCNVIINLIRSRRANIHNLADRYLDLRSSNPDSLIVSDSTTETVIKQQASFRNAFDKRLQKLIDICRQNNILPVLITQPLLVGKGVDDVSGVSLETLKLNSTANGKSFWMVLESYNDVSRRVAARNNILLIDAARLMPKSSAYFYDMLHYTNAGAKHLGDLIYDELKDYLAARYPDHLRLSPMSSHPGAKNSRKDSKVQEGAKTILQ